MGRVPLMLLTALAATRVASAGAPVTRVCSCETPLCLTGVHVAPALLVEAEAVYRTLFAAMELPPPPRDLDGRVTLHLGAKTGATIAFRDPMTPIDRAIARLTVATLSGNSCDIQLHFARALVHASLLGAAPATDATMATAQVEWASRMAVPCATVDRSVTFAPEAPLAGTTLSTESPQSTVQFLDFLDRRHGRDVATWLVGAWANTVARSEPGAALVDEPDFFDVLSATYKTTSRAGWHDVFGAFLSDQAGRAVAPQWEVPWPKGARRLLATRPVFPTGMTFVRIGPEGALPTRLRLAAEWEPQTLMRWVAVVMGADGRAARILPFTGFDKGGHAERSVENLSGAHHVEVMGAALEDRDFKFDPDIGLGEPHAWMLTVAGE
jgi:hypothetical protein